MQAGAVPIHDFSYMEDGRIGAAQGIFCGGRSAQILSHLTKTKLKACAQLQSALVLGLLVQETAGLRDIVVK